MIKKKSLILSLVVVLLNFPTQSFSYSPNNFQQLATLNQESGEGSSGSSGGGSSENSSEESNGESGESQNGGSVGDFTGGENGNSSGDSTGNGNSNVTQPVTDSVQLDGAIGQWDPGNNQLPNFGDNDLEVEGNKPEDEQYFTISATVPLQMEFLIQNENENGSSPYGKFITPYYKVKNNGSYPLYIEVESFEDATQSTRTSDLVDGSLGKLYVEEPKSKDGKVQMRLHLTYDRTSNSYLNRIDLHNLNKNAKSSMRMLGTIDSNEVARIYYGSDLWETPKSENIQTGVASTFKLKLAFSLKKENNNNNTEGNNNTDNQGNDVTDNEDTDDTITQ